MIFLSDRPPHKSQNILIQLGFGRESTPHDNVPGEIYFYTSLTLDHQQPSHLP
jgi:hypothetical protein